MTSRHDHQQRNKLRFDIKQYRVSHSLTRADRTNGREMLCSPELHQTTRTSGFSNAPLPCLQCFCSVSKRATVHARTRQWAVRTHGCDIVRCDKCNNSVIICTCMYKCSAAWMVRLCELRVFLWCIGLVYHIGHPQPTDRSLLSSLLTRDKHLSVC